jgi:hypothetical protein
LTCAVASVPELLIATKRCCWFDYFQVCFFLNKGHDPSFFFQGPGTAEADECSMAGLLVRALMHYVNAAPGFAENLEFGVSTSRNLRLRSRETIQLITGPTITTQLPCFFGGVGGRGGIEAHFLVVEKLRSSLHSPRSPSTAIRKNVCERTF